MYEPLEARGFGNKPPSKESQDAREARLVQKAATDTDVRGLRLRRRRLAAGRQASSLFGAGEGVSLGAGL